MTPLTDTSLSGKRILVVEDEYWLATEIAAALKHDGAEVLGPVGTLEEAQKLLDSRPDCAVLDVNLHGEMAFPIAARLQEADVPFAVATGYGSDALPAALATVPQLQKPFDTRDLRKLLPSLIARSHGA